MQFPMNFLPVLGLWLDDRCLIPSRCRKLFSSPPRPGRPLGPPRFLSSGFRGLFP